MPQSKKGSGGQKPKGPGDKRDSNTANNASGQQKPRPKKHKDPYVAATGQSIDDIVKSIEEAAAQKPKTSQLQAKPQPVTKAEDSAPSQQPRDAQREAQKDNNNNKKNRRQRNKKKADKGPPPKAGMTKAQRREHYQKQRETAGGRIPLPRSEDFAEEDDSEGHDDNEDYSDTQNERAKEYRKGGYHPVVVGDVYNDRYRIVKKLGWGYFSTVWLVWDYVTSTFQALKIQKSAEHYRDAAFDEIRLLSEIMSADDRRDRCCARMNDYFEHVGPNGTHVCMVFDVLGENLLTLMEWYEYRGIPLPIVKAIAQQVLIGLEHIHSIQILHTDLKPENVLLSTPKHKIMSIMKHYKPTPLHKRPALVTKDVKSMTKSQKRRYYQKLKKSGGSFAGHSASGDGDTAADSDTESAEQSGTQCSGTAPSADQASAGAATPTPGERKVDEFGVPCGDDVSETDPEWEIERFHHVCLADFGNSCWTYRQFTDEVQTRQYRSPEVILGNGYSTPIDLWSAACMFFELITGEFLFDPKQGDNYSRDEDHLALMSELLGELPEEMRLGNGKFRSQFYNSQGKLRHIKQLNFWELPDILHSKYRFTTKKANEIAEFLLPMLTLNPDDRATATDMLNNFQHFFEVQDDDYAPYCYVQGGEDAENESDRDQLEEDGAEGDDEGVVADTSDRKAKRASSADEAELKEWWNSHPLLNEAALADRGLSIHDVQLALANQPLETEEKQLAVEELLLLLEQMEVEDEVENAAEETTEK